MTQQPAAGERPATEAIDRLYLELSQFTRATTGREVELMKKAEDLRDTCCKMVEELATLRKQLSDQADEISMLNAEAEMWQQRAEMAEREAVRVNERLAAAERLLIETYKQAGNSAPAERRHALTAQLRDNMRDYIKANCAVAAGWLPHPAEAEQLEGGG